jgi:hypothetical protein
MPHAADSKNSRARDVKGLTMPDYLSIFERTLKAVRFGIFQASDNLAYLLDGFCRAPEDSAASPQVADDPAGGDLAPTPEAGATSLPGHPTCKYCAGPIQQYPPGDAVSVWLHNLGDGRTRMACLPTYASPK